MDPIDGFVLTRNWRDTPQGVLLTYWLLSEQGPLRLRYPEQRAVMFVEREVAALADERKPVELATLHHTPVDALYFRSRRSQLEERDRLRQRAMVYESDVKPSERFLMERFVTGGCRVHGPLQRRDGYADMRSPRMSTGDYRPKLKLASIDIETDGLEGALLSIALVTADAERVFMRGNGPPSPGIEYHADERALLQAFFQALRSCDPDAIIGWNVVDFDLTFLQRRCEVLRVPFHIGRAGGRGRVLLPQRADQLPLARIPGRVVLDGIGLLKSATYSFERFGLNHVARELLGSGKHIADPEQASGAERVAEIVRMFQHDKPALAEYNLQDCRLVQQIFDKADLIAFAIERQRMTGLPLDRVGGSVAAFDNLYLPRLHRAGFVAADVGAGSRGGNSPGGYVLASRPGLYRNVLVLDFKSLYPSIIRTFFVDPLGLACPGEDAVEGFDGAKFSRSRHILPALIESLWCDREQAKQRQDKPLSRAIKIIMNSFYGVLGTPACRFYSPLLASSITKRGHELITRSRDWIEQQGWQVIYGDTDSLFVLVGDGEDPAGCQQIGNTLSEQLNAWWAERVEAEHNCRSHLEVEFEVHYQRFFMPTLRGSERGSAKRYAGLVCDPRTQEPRVAIKGLEAVRTDWTPLARRFQRELLRRIFCDEPVEAYVRAIRPQLLGGELDAELVYRKRLRRDVADYQRNAPPHVRAARMLDEPGRDVAYVWTVDGPQPTAKQRSQLDYHHYLRSQLEPAADGLLHCLGMSFEQLAGDQLQLFSA